MPLPGVPVLPSQGLTDGRVRLRALGSHHVALLQQLSQDVDVVRWTSYPPDLDEGRALARINRGNSVADRAVFCVAELDGQPAGTCGASIADADGDIEIFYAVLSWARRQGVASRAAAMLAAAAHAAGAAGVTLVTHLDNSGSQLVAKRAGFVQLRQESRVVKGTPTNVQLWRWEVPRD